VCARLQQVGECGDVPDLAKVVDDLQARFDLPLAQLRLWHQRAVLGVDVGPVNAAPACSLRRVDGVRKDSAVPGANGHGGALFVTLDVFGRRYADSDLVDELLDNRIGDFCSCTHEKSLSTTAAARK
jgi:hypothetical protein